MLKKSLAEIRIPEALLQRCIVSDLGPCASHGFGSAEETNKRFKFLLDHGQTGLLHLHLTCQLRLAGTQMTRRQKVKLEGQVFPLASIKDMMTCFDSIPFDKVSTSMTINSTASTLLSLYITVAENQGVSLDQLRGTTQNDILKEYIARNTYIYPPKPSMRLIGDMIEYCSKKVPQWYPDQYFWISYERSWL